VKFLDGQVLKPRGEHFHDVARRPDWRTVIPRLTRHPASELEGRMHRCRTSRTDSSDRRQRRDRLHRDPTKRTPCFRQNGVAELQSRSPQATGTEQNREQLGRAQRLGTKVDQSLTRPVGPRQLSNT
jgi:hypothetical protein